MCDVVFGNGLEKWHAIIMFELYDRRIGVMLKPKTFGLKNIHLLMLVFSNTSRATVERYD